MGILIFLLGGLVAGLFLLGIAVRIVQAVGLLALLMLGAACLGIVYLSLAVAGITFAVSYEMLGSRSLGWPAAIAGFVGLSVGWAMFGAVLKEVSRFIVGDLAGGQAIYGEDRDVALCLRLPATPQEETKPDQYRKSGWS